jgi:DivIVA domain-containing protein
MAIDLSPRFTVSLRGYDKEEVERYLATVSERSSQDSEQLDELQEQNRYLEEEHERLAARVEELEAAIRSETPHTVSALGERITLILNEAEEGASETLAKAKAEADYILAEARSAADALHQEASVVSAQAVETLAAARRQAADLAEQLEADATARASAILSDAELRAQRRQEQIEEWAQQMVAHTRGVHAQLADEFAMVRRTHEAEVRSLIEDRDDTIAALRSLQLSLAHAIEKVVDGASPGPDADVAAGPAGASGAGAPTGATALAGSGADADADAESYYGDTASDDERAVTDAIGAHPSQFATVPAPPADDLEDDPATSPTTVVRISDWSSEDEAG